MDIDFKITKQGEGWRLGNQSTSSINQKNSLVVRADGLNHFFNMIASEMGTAKQKRSSDGLKSDRKNFYYFEDFRTAWETMRNKPQVISEFIKTDMKVKEFGQSGNDVEYDVTGDYIDMGRHMEGIPEQFGYMTNGNAKNLRARILIDISVPWMVKQHTIHHKAKAILSLVDSLESAGVRCELVVVSSDQCANVEIKLKNFDDPLEIEDLAVVANPDFLRRMLFRVIEHSAAYEGGYGTSGRIDDLIAQNPEKLMAESGEELVIFISGMMFNNEVVDSNFNQIQKLIEWELSKPVNEIAVLATGRRGVGFLPNGARDKETILREGREVMGQWKS